MDLQGKDVLNGFLRNWPMSGADPVSVGSPP